MVASGGSRLRTFVVHAQFGDGLFVAPVPDDLPPERIESPNRGREQARIPWKNERIPGRRSRPPSQQ
jgi:hypothetical protein